jgi:hypothetical protein
MLNARELLLLAASALALAACGKKADTAAGGEAEKAPATAGGDAFAAAEAALPASAERQVFFGAVHVHTSNSFDAFTNGTRTTPQDAYDWAKGKEITNSGFGGKIQNVTPLDFYMVSDHAEFMGAMGELADPESPLSKSDLGKNIMSPDANTRLQTFAGILRDMSAGNPPAVLTDTVLARTVWSRIVKAADENYAPGKFTTFAGFEWTSNPKQRNLHRVVMFRDTKVLPEIVLSALQSEDPETLWKWMNEQRARGATLLAIPHNGNASDGRMFELVKFDGKPLDAAYNATRAQNEPLYEITQIKGTSETWPTLSPNDEFAGFEQWNYTLSADAERPRNHRGGFVRQALLDGMAEEAAGRGNPFKYGYIGDTDTHNAAASNEEFNYSGKFAFENDPEDRMKGVEGQPAGQAQQVREFSSGGIAAVWAEKNTRGAIYDAMVRKETFATSGPLMRVRFFAGWDLGTADLGEGLAKAGYARGVPMGSDLKGTGKAPTFLVAAMKDPKSGNLDRVQIVKGWIDAAGKQHEQVYDVVWSGERKPGRDGKLPAVGNTVDLKTAKYTNTIGAAELATAWTDPSFDPKQRAFYYARVLEIPTPRWSTYDAVKLGVPIPKGLAATLQERAWTSPIWYTPM